MYSMSGQQDSMSGKGLIVVTLVMYKNVHTA